jgi:hypothetical protein
MKPGKPSSPVSGERSSLWREYRRVVADVGPRFVFVENVPGLLTADDGHAFAEVLGDLAALGFDATWDVLHEHEPRSHVSNDPAKITPEARPLAREPRALSGEADVLAGEAAADEVDGGESVDGADVVISNSVRPVLCENVTTPRIPFHLPADPPARGVLQAEFQSADSREERPDRERVHHATARICSTWATGSPTDARARCIAASRVRASPACSPRCRASQSASVSPSLSISCGAK